MHRRDLNALQKTRGAETSAGNGEKKEAARLHRRVGLCATFITRDFRGRRSEVA
jgi:hypothetical protein